MSCREPVLDWDCDKKGCFNIKKRLKFAAFKGALARGGLPSSISFSDVDGYFERHGYFFFVEWKDPGVEIPQGQDISFKSLTKLSDKIVVLAVGGDAEDMTCESWTPFYNGDRMNDVFGNFDDFLAVVEDWASIAEFRTFNEDVIARGRKSRGLDA